MDNHQEEQEKIIEEDDQDGGWVDTHHFACQYFCLFIYLSLKKNIASSFEWAR